MSAAEQLNDDNIVNFRNFESEKLEKFLPDWLKFQIEMDPATKSSWNPHHKSKYANLNEVMKAIKPALFRNGFCFTQRAFSRSNGNVLIYTKIWHAASTQWLASLLELKPDKATPQGAGSAITYGKRYSLEAMCGLESEDDDGNEASGLSENQRSAALGAPNTEKRVADCLAAFAELKVTRQQLEAKLGREMEKCTDQDFDRLGAMYDELKAKMTAHSGRV